MNHRTQVATQFRRLRTQTFWFLNHLVGVQREDTIFNNIFGAFFVKTQKKEDQMRDCRHALARLIMSETRNYQTNRGLLPFSRAFLTSDWFTVFPPARE